MFNKHWRSSSQLLTEERTTKMSIIYKLNNISCRDRLIAIMTTHASNQHSLRYNMINSTDSLSKADAVGQPLSTKISIDQTQDEHTDIPHFST